MVRLKRVPGLRANPFTVLVAWLVTGLVFLAAGLAIPGQDPPVLADWTRHEDCEIQAHLVTADRGCMGFGIVYPEDGGNGTLASGGPDTWAVDSANPCPGSAAVNQSIQEFPVHRTTSCLVPLEPLSVVRCAIQDDETDGLARSCVGLHTVTLGPDASSVVEAIIAEFQPDRGNWFNWFFLGIGALLLSLLGLLVIGVFARAYCGRSKGTIVV